MVRIERLTFRSGWNKFFYVTENESVDLSVLVHKYSPEERRTDEALKRLEPGIYVFRVYFNLGKYVFIFFENGNRMLVTIVTVTENG
jgi:hypothetical protein